MTDSPAAASLAEVHAWIRQHLAQMGQPPGTAVEAVLHRAVRPCYHLDFEETPDEELPVASSKFGGQPDVPPDWTWPRSPAGVPLRFLCQFRLDQLPDRAPDDDEPPHGLLSFFWLFHPDEQLVVQYWPQVDELGRRPSLPPDGYAYRSRQVLAHRALSLVELSVPSGLTGEEDDRFCWLRHGLSQSGFFEFSPATLFGHVDRASFLACADLAAARGQRGWTLADPAVNLLRLFNISHLGDDVLEDTGDNHLYTPEFILPCHALRARRFDRAHYELGVD
ncbi:DUF1963 domain-containing protein [Deinococcus multiflagellatus]|uniref:DUF1963 domain-containing protein n=1 Tax=Deinococcus multiflagellatus TaxID=1656887 RepID=A0ABW1ZKK1_9DEIO|nr:DUF1963 domain-containing protein [Deinococcus multiflagellatus]MBZ9714767.1 DUF1963 domain-containing protein [Deinococcus multiflagellatus]